MTRDQCCEKEIKRKKDIKKKEREIERRMRGTEGQTDRDEWKKKQREKK